MVRSSPLLSPLWFTIWVASSVQPPVEPARRSVEARLRIRPRSGGLESRGGGEDRRVAMPPADDLEPHGQPRRGEADGDRRRRLSGEVERIGERDPAERPDLAA